MSIHIRTSLFVLFFLIIPNTIFAQPSQALVDSVSAQTPKCINKNIPEILDSEIKEALSFYPELKDTHIDFVFRDKINHAVMQAQPRVKTLFRKKENRVYKIKMCRMLTLNDSVKAIQDLPHDIIVGWVAHELGHIIDYLDRSSFQMIGFGMRYFTSRNYLRQAERRADTYAVNHGFAEQIIKTKDYILHREDLPASYKARIDQLYISTEEVRLIEKDQEKDIN